MAPRTWCPAGISGLFCPLAQPTPTSPLPCLTTNPSILVSPHTQSLDGRQIRVDHAGKSARGTRGGAFGGYERGRGYPRGKLLGKFDHGVQRRVAYQHSISRQLPYKYFFPIVGGGDQGYGSGRYDNRPGAYGFGYGYGYGRTRDYGGRWVTKGLGYTGASSLSLRTHLRDLSGGPVAKTLYSQCRGPGINPWSDPTCHN